MQAVNVMINDPICCSRTTSVMNAARMLHEYDIGILPVVDELWLRKLMGVVTDRDLCLGALSEGHDATLTTVEDCMTTDLFTCTPETDIREVVATMAERQIRRVPVINKDGNILGIIGISDLVRHNAISPSEVCTLLQKIVSPEYRARAEAA